MQVSKASDNWRFTIKYKALKLSKTLFTNLKATLAEKPNKAFKAKLAKLNRGSKFPLNSKRLLKEFLQQLREYCKNWCNSYNFQMPLITTTSYLIA